MSMLFGERTFEIQRDADLFVYVCAAWYKVN